MARLSSKKAARSSEHKDKIMVCWYYCKDCKTIVDEFELQYDEDLLCQECRKNNDGINRTRDESQMSDVRTCQGNG